MMRSTITIRELAAKCDQMQNGKTTSVLVIDDPGMTVEKYVLQLQQNVKSFFKYRCNLNIS